MALPAAAGEQSFSCRIDVLRVNADRFFVSCRPPAEGERRPLKRDIVYFSAPYAQPNARYLFDLMLDANRRGRPVRLIVEDDAAANPPGCRKKDCRRIIAAGISAR